MYITRTLSQENDRGERVVVRDASLLQIDGPTIILGDPGSGKTRLLQWLADQSGHDVVRARAFARKPRQQESGLPLLIDALDEYSAAREGDALDAVLTALTEADVSRFILSCREIDWNSGNRREIQDELGVLPRIYHLDPLTQDQAHEFLFKVKLYPDPEALLRRLAEHRLQSLSESPLTLGMLADVASDEGALPRTRAELYNRATHLMASETNEGHENSALAALATSDVLDSAGAISAALIIAGSEKIITSGIAAAPPQALRVSVVQKLPFGSAAPAVLGSRLFEGHGDSSFAPIHKTVAEFLAARWIGRLAESGVPRRRLLSLLQPNGGVPASLRGLHAWTAYHSDKLAAEVIKTDPYGVIQYGDGETMPVPKARTLLASLRSLSEVDPWFMHGGGWMRHPAPAITQKGMADEVKISAP